MSKKYAGKLEAAERVGLRDVKTNELVKVYPNIVRGTDQEIEEKVKSWFYQQSLEDEKQLESYFVDTLTPMELKNAEEKFTD